MELSELTPFLKKTFEAIKEQYAEEIALVAAVVLRKSMQERIFTEGKNSNEGLIASEYSTKPMYASKKQVGAGFKPTGKGDKVEKKYTTGKSGVDKLKTKITKKGKVKKGRKTMYLDEGYRQLRQLKGRQTNFVNLKMTGSLQAAIRYYKRKGYAIIAIADDHEIKKSKGLEKKYGSDIFLPTEKEKQVVNKAISDEVGETLKKLLS